MSQIDKGRAPAPLSIRLTNDERTTLKKAAADQPLGAYVRDRLFGEKANLRKRRFRAPVKDQEALARALGMLGRSHIANHLRHLSEEAKFGALVLDSETQEKINEAHAHVVAIRNELIRALGLIEEMGE